MKIVILGSLQNGPYEVTYPKIIDPEKYKNDHHAAYEDAKKIFYPKIEESDLVIVILQGKEITYHTKKDIQHALVNDKRVVMISPDDAFDMRNL